MSGWLLIIATASSTQFHVPAMAAQIGPFNTEVACNVAAKHIVAKVVPVGTSGATVVCVPQ